MFIAYKDGMMIDYHEIIECFKVGSRGFKGLKGFRWVIKGDQVVHGLQGHHYA